jgi:hypothetical protein
MSLSSAASYDLLSSSSPDCPRCSACASLTC